MEEETVTIPNEDYLGLLHTDKILNTLYNGGMEEETVTIPKEDYLKLLRADAILHALYNGGVDNWELYDEAISALEE